MIHDPLPPAIYIPLWQVTARCSCGWTDIWHDDRRAIAEDKAKRALERHLKMHQAPEEG